MSFAVVAIGLAAAVAGLLAYMTSMPGRSYSGPLPALSGEGRALSLRLRLHVAALAANQRNLDLETPARYIEQAFKSQGVEFSTQEFVSGGRKVRNIEAGSGTIVVGAHYDTVPGSPGADDNASGVAVLIELAALLKNETLPIRFVAFANEEMPYFQGPEMGSWTWARRARERSEPIRAMYSLEMLGYYRDAPGSQRYPPPLGLFYPDRADFVAFVGDLGARSLVRNSIRIFREKSLFPSEGVAAPAFIPGVTWSDHWSFRSHGFPAIMITDTAFNRYPHYHLPSDTPDKLDYERMARVTLGLAAMLKDLANETR
ncbi:MAG TPA: M28 family peptidase [Burkholderiales bacterium]|nr:M28 family peptidase [Burkholderiales bacterium]